MTDITDEPPVQALLRACCVRPTEDGTFTTDAPDWFGDRVFGGMVVAAVLSAACGTVDGDWLPHSMHASFLGAVRPGPITLGVERVRDGRTFLTRRVTVTQGGRDTTDATVSFHRDEAGPEYQLPAPEVPSPEECQVVDSPPPFEVRWIGPTDQRADGTYASTRRTWVRTVEPLPDGPMESLVVAGFLSDMTGTSFRPHNLGDWGTHTDASIDHAVWFHRPFRADEWLLADWHALINAGGRSTVRGEHYDGEGRLVMSVAQELLIRPLDRPPQAGGPAR
jgi:acyl-CoA thioesterase II